MSENKHIDERMKFILESGQEDVPAHIWDGISSELDRAAQRRKVVVLFKRVGIAIAAAIAGTLLYINHDDGLAPEGERGMIAVVDEEIEVAGAESAMIADAGKTMIPVVKMSRAIIPMKASVPTETATVPTESAVQTKTETEISDVPSQEAPSIQMGPSQTTSSSATESQAHSDNSAMWIEEPERPRNRIRASLVISGIAGTNNPQESNGIGPMKSPATGKQYTKTTVEHGSSEATYGIPLSFGAGIKLRFTDRWSLGIGVNYSLLTSRFNGKYIKVNEDGTEDLPVIDKISNRQHYIGIPLNVYYDIMKSKTVNFYAYAGGTVEKCIGNNYQVLTTPVIHHTEQPKGVQLSVNAGIGAEFMLGRHLGLYIDPSLRYYFNNGQPKSIRTAQPLMLGFEMGLRFNL
jgi:hypothetical protein